MKTRLLSTFCTTLLLAGAMHAQIANFTFDSNVLDQLEGISSTPSPSGITFVNTSKGAVAEFDGTNGYVTFANTIYTYDAISFNIWFQWNNTNANPWWQRVFDFGKASDPAPGNHDVMFVTTYQESKLTWHIHSVNWTDGVDTVLSSKEALTIGKWYMLTMTHAQDSAKLYLDGVLQGSKASNIKPSELAFDNCYLGKSNWPDNLFQGRFDDFKVWDKILTASEIAAMYVPPTTAINENIEQIASVYSFGNSIKIDFANNSINNSASIYNIQGAEVYNNNNLGSYTEINNLETGIYLIRVRNSSGVATSKIYVQ
jgi:hypothetical protein